MTNITYNAIKEASLNEKRERRKEQLEVDKKAYEQVEGDDGSDQEVESLNDDDEDHSTEAS